MEDAFTLEKRSYSDSMEGILAASSTTGNTIGVNRTLTYNANVTSNRGYLKPADLDDTTDLDMGNLLSVGEMSTPLVASHDSMMRVISYLHAINLFNCWKIKFNQHQRLH